MGQILINCDLGENEPDERTESLLGLVDAVNICCGVHAGSVAKTQKTLRRAAGKGLLIGAHPGLTVDGGRGSGLPGPEDFQNILKDQLTRLIAYADHIEAWVSYVKLHGSLYHAVEHDAALAEVYLHCLKSVGVGFGVSALAGGAFQEKARAVDLVVREEVFADRGYRSDGSLVPRTEIGALLDAETALTRIEKWLSSGLMDTVDGGAIALKAETVCVHADSPDAETLLAGLRNLLSV